jgi:hypothetical protein
VIERIPKCATTVLINSDGQPPRPARHHLFAANLSIREIAEILGWQEVLVDRIIRLYVGRKAATKALIRRLSEFEK